MAQVGIAHAGLEHPSDFPKKQGIPPAGGAFSGALNVNFDPKLAEVVRAWPQLPVDVKADILAIIRGEFQ